MRRGLVKIGGEPAGILEETDQGYRFCYDPEYLSQPNSVAVSLTLALQPEPFLSSHLFAYFEGLIAEGSLREMQSRRYQIDEQDSFGLLLKTASSDVIGNVTVETLEETS